MAEWALCDLPTLSPGSSGGGGGEGKNEGLGAALAEQPVLRPMPISGFDPSQNSLFFPQVSQSFRRRGPKVEIQAYTVQCAQCLRWRTVPSPELYESIRQRVSERPWNCKDAAWNPDASCSEPSDLEMQTSCQETIWALDKPDLPKTPRGWKRDLVIRSEGCVKFGDIYYTSPCGRRLRSMVEIRKFLEENPVYTVPLSKFCFTTPQPVDKSYIRKRPRPDALTLHKRMKALRDDQANEMSSFPPVPPGWIREIVVRSLKSSKLCDVYYISPCRKKIRSMVEMNEFLHGNPSYVFQGVSLDRFSFTAPGSERDLRRIARVPGCTVRALMRGSIDHPGAQPPPLLTSSSAEIDDDDEDEYQVNEAHLRLLAN